jgi:hypothetical protein
VQRARADGTELVVLASDASRARVDASGTWVVFLDSTGVFRRRADLSLPRQRLFSGFAYALDVSGDGAVVAFNSYDNPLGTNPENNREVFVWESSTGLRQLTQTTSGDHDPIALTRDGAWVIATTTAPYFDPFPESEIARIRVATGAVERIGGLRPCAAERIAAGQDETRVAIAARRDCTGGNPDGNAEILLIDGTVLPAIRVSPGSVPTVVSWDVESGPASYDVIRGDVEELSAGPGGTVSLGAVSCLENDSADASTEGHEDPAVPSPGEAYFYVYRGSAGVLAGPGSFGRGSSGGERLPDSGGCP